MDIKKLYDIYLEYPQITIDTRNIKRGQLFFALKGPSFNGNSFALKALEMGASYVVVDEEIPGEDGRILKTHNVLETLQSLAKFHRQQFDIPFIAITGSNGKTTTKELAALVLSSSYHTYSTFGNLNNHIGIPLTILKIPKTAEFAVIEMGANHQKEIESYCKFTLPTHGLITNCGKAHLEGFGGVEGVVKGKGELFEYLRVSNGIAFVNNYDDKIKLLSAPITKKYSYGPAGDVQGDGEIVDSKLVVKVTGSEEVIIKSRLVGNYNLPNVLAAIAIGKFFKVSADKIKDAIESYTPSNSRSQFMQIGSNEVVLDAYNANPTSMKAAIENFSFMSGSNKYLFLGAMMELGEESVAEHTAIIKLIDQYSWANVVLVGDNFNKISHKYVKMKNVYEARQWYKMHKIRDSIILIKGSRSMQMEKILE